jgi:hypothetical protein
MRRTRQLALFSMLALAAPVATAAAEPQWGRPAPQVAYGYNEGYERGLRAGSEDARRGDVFQFADESDYRRGDVAYRSEYGNRDRYRDDFRRGFEVGYRAGYSRDGYDNGRGASGRYGGPGGPWGNGRGSVTGRFDLAYEAGFNDGYEAGMNDGRANRRFDPISEGRYRSADRGYARRYGSRDAYRNNYRDAFRQGYSRGFEDARRYGNSRSWWPF